MLDLNTVRQRERHASVGLRHQRAPDWESPMPIQVRGMVYLPIGLSKRVHPIFSFSPFFPFGRRVIIFPIHHALIFFSIVYYNDSRLKKSSMILANPVTR